MQSRTVCFWPVVPLGFGGSRLGSRLLGGGASCRTLRALSLIFSILLGRLAGLPARGGLEKIIQLLCVMDLDPYNPYVRPPGSVFVIIFSDPDPDPSVIKQNK
jgi:hypothetical protein